MRCGEWFCLQLSTAGGAPGPSDTPHVAWREGCESLQEPQELDNQPHRAVCHEDVQSLVASLGNAWPKASAPSWLKIIYPLKNTYGHSETTLTLILREFNAINRLLEIMP